MSTRMVHQRHPLHKYSITAVAFRYLTVAIGSGMNHVSGMDSSSSREGSAQWDFSVCVWGGGGGGGAVFLVLLEIWLSVFQTAEVA